MKIKALILATALFMFSCETGTKEETHDDIVPTQEGLVNEDGDPESPSTGASDPNMLAEKLYEAFQTNSFNVLSDIVPSDQIMNRIYIKGSRDTGIGEVSPLTKGQEVMAEELKTEFNLAREASQKTNLDWTKTTLGALHFDTEEKDRFLVAHLTIPVIGAGQAAYVIRADAIQVDDKWYLMDNISFEAANTKAAH